MVDFTLDSTEAALAALPEPPHEVVDVPPEKTGRPDLVRALVIGVAVLGALMAAVVVDPSTIKADPLVFVLLVISFLVLDVVRIDLFERGNISPASVPALALACTFGPFGPIVAETVLALRRLVQRESAMKWGFDWGSLGMAGMAAALAFYALPHGSPAEVALSGLAAALVYYAVNAA